MHRRVQVLVLLQEDHLTQLLYPRQQVHFPTQIHLQRHRKSFHPDPQKMVTPSAVELEDKRRKGKEKQLEKERRIEERKIKHDEKERIKLIMKEANRQAPKIPNIIKCESCGKIFETGNDVISPQLANECIDH